MQINVMEPVTRNRVRLVLDNGESFILYSGELRLLKIKGVGVLSDEVYHTIVSDILPKRARMRAMHLLTSRDYTEHQLRSKLCESGYPDTVVDAALEYVRSYGYVNDSRYAVEFISQERERHNRKEIEIKLMRKGIPQSVIEEAFFAVYRDSDGDNPESDELMLIRKALSKLGFTGAESYEERQKLLARFYRKGFSPELVRTVMDGYTM